MAKGFSIQHIATTPAGWHVRTVKAGGHRVRVAFPPGRRAKGSGITVEVLHPRNENPTCGFHNGAAHRCDNPAELLLMGANPLSQREKQQQKSTRERATRIRSARLSNPYDRLSTQEKLAFGRLGLGKAQLRTSADIRRARRKVSEVGRFRNAFPNPGAGNSLPSLESPQAEHARELFESFHETASDKYIVTEEPHIPAGDYTDLGKLIGLGVAPERKGQLQEISFPGKNIRVISNASGRQIYLAGDGQDLTDDEVQIFSESHSERVELGECRFIAYEAAKWHRAVPDSVRGVKVPWQHAFGEDGGYPPKLFYDRAKQRLLLEGGTYHVEGAGIVN
jgi:hypothetical protein